MLKLKINKNYFRSEKGAFDRLFLFIVSGFIVAGIQLLLFIWLESLVRHHYIFSSTVAFIVAVFVSYFLQRNITFAKFQERELGQKTAFLLFITNSGFSLLLNFLIMYTGVELFDFNSFWTQISSMILLAIYNFAAYRFIFK